MGTSGKTEQLIFKIRNPGTRINGEMNGGKLSFLIHDAIREYCHNPWVNTGGQPNVSWTAENPIKRHPALSFFH
jgi:hypothetical protein